MKEKEAHRNNTKGQNRIRREPSEKCAPTILIIYLGRTHIKIPQTAPINSGSILSRLLTCLPTPLAGPKASRTKSESLERAPRYHIKRERSQGTCTAILQHTYSMAVTWRYRLLARCWCCWWGEFAFSARLPPQTEALKWWQHHSPPYWRTAELGSVLLSLARAHWPGALCTVKGGWRCITL